MKMEFTSAMTAEVDRLEDHGHQQDSDAQHDQEDLQGGDDDTGERIHDLLLYGLPGGAGFGGSPDDLPRNRSKAVSSVRVRCVDPHLEPAVYSAVGLVRKAISARARRASA